MAYRTAFHSIPAGWEKWTNPPAKEAPVEAGNDEAESAGTEGEESSEKESAE